MTLTAENGRITRKALLDDALVEGMRRALERLNEAPRADLYETPETVVVELEVPGFDRDDVRVQVRDQTVTVQGRRRKHANAERRAYRLRERVPEVFERRFTLTPDADTTALRASLREGLLELRMRRRPFEHPRAVKVEGRIPWSNPEATGC